MDKFQAIRCALTIRKYGKISKAADVLFMAQPNLSRTLAALEEELGFALFSRSKKGLTVTSQGERYLTQAEGLLEELANLEKACRCEQLSHVTIATIESSLYINHILDAMQQYPELPIEFTENDLDEVIELVESEKAEFGLIIIPYSQQKNYEKYFSGHGLAYFPICRTPYFLLTNRQNPYFREREKPDLNKLKHCILSSTQHSMRLKDESLGTYLPKECRILERNVRSSNMDFLDTFPNGVMITFQTHQRVLRRNDLISIPLRQLPLSMEYAYVCKKRKKLEKPVKMILGVLCEEVKNELEGNFLE